MKLLHTYRQGFGADNVFVEDQHHLVHVFFNTNKNDQGPLEQLDLPYR